MPSPLVAVGPPLGIAMVLLTALGAAASAMGRLGHTRHIATAAARAAAQLLLVSVLIASILSSLALTALFVAFMYVVAARTAGRRMTRGTGGWWAAIPIVATSAPVVLALLTTGILPLNGLAVIPVAGILIGGAMTATSLAGRIALHELTARRGEVEAALSLGISERDAQLEVCRPAAANALIPALDQTRTVGLVTLPGAFVGMLLSGATPIDAGAVQLFVLIALLAVEAVAVVLTIELIVRRTIRIDRKSATQLSMGSRASKP